MLSRKKTGLLSGEKKVVAYACSRQNRTCPTQLPYPIFRSQGILIHEKYRTIIAQVICINYENYVTKYYVGANSRMYRTTQTNMVYETLNLPK